MLKKHENTYTSKISWHTPFCLLSIARMRSHSTCCILPCCSPLLIVPPPNKLVYRPCYVNMNCEPKIVRRLMYQKWFSMLHILYTAFAWIILQKCHWLWSHHRILHGIHQKTFYTSMLIWAKRAFLNLWVEYNQHLLHILCLVLLHHHLWFNKTVQDKTWYGI